MNIFQHELNAYRKSLLIWTFSLAALVVLFLSMFPAISQEAANFQSLMEGFPESVRLALGLSGESIGSLLGYYAYIFLYLSLVGAVQAMILGASLISKEVRHKTADFLLTKPVTRTRIMTSKLLAAVASLLITNVVYLGTATLMASLVATKEFSLKIFLLLSLTLFFLQLIFLALGIVVSVIIPRLKSVISISLGTVFAFFFLSALASTSEDRALRFFSPFRYFDYAYIIENARYEVLFMLMGLAIIVLAIAASYLLYTRRDIPTA